MRAIRWLIPVVRGLELVAVLRGVKSKGFDRIRPGRYLQQAAVEVPARPVP